MTSAIDYERELHAKALDADEERRDIDARVGAAHRLAGDLTRLQRASAIGRCRSAVRRAEAALEERNIRLAIEAMRTAEVDLAIAAGSDEMAGLARLVDAAWDAVTMAACRTIAERGGAGC